MHKSYKGGLSMKRTEKQQELYSQYKPLMRRANERLRELEKLATNPEYENVLGYAYRAAARDIKELGIGDSEKIRFRMPTNTNQMEAAIRRVERFLSMPTSTKTGIKETYAKDAKAFNKAFGTSFTWQELKRFLDASDWNRLKDEKGSKVLQSVIKSFSSAGIDVKKNQSISDAIAEANAKHKDIAKVDEVQRDWAKRLQDSGLRFDMLQYDESVDDSDLWDENPFF